MNAPANKCAMVRDHIRANPGCTYAHIASGIGIPSNKFLKDIRKMVARGLVLCEDRDGVRHHSIGREPAKLFGLPAEVRKRRKLDQQKEHRNRPEIRAKRNARRRKGAPVGKRDRSARERVSVALSVLDAAPARVAVPVAAQTVEEFLAAGGRVERLSSYQAPPAYGRRAA